MTVDVEPTYTIAKIKELLEEKEGIPVRDFLQPPTWVLQENNAWQACFRSFFELLTDKHTFTLLTHV